MCSDVISRVCSFCYLFVPLKPRFACMSFNAELIVSEVNILVMLFCKLRAESSSLDQIVKTLQ